ncbi:MAG: MFS transporter [Saccharopolyspora rectivirgula]
MESSASASCCLDPSVPHLLVSGDPSQPAPLNLSQSIDLNFTPAAQPSPEVRSTPFARAALARAAAPSASPVVVGIVFAGIVVSPQHALIIPLVPPLPGLPDSSAANAPGRSPPSCSPARGQRRWPVGRGDVHGKRRVLLIGLARSVAGSPVCGVGATPAQVVLGRALQGLAPGVIPLGIGIVRDALPAERLASATALMRAPLVVGGAFGPPGEPCWARAPIGTCSSGRCLRRGGRGRRDRRCGVRLHLPRHRRVRRRRGPLAPGAAVASPFR